MPTQVIAGTLTGSADATATVVTPRLIMGDASGRAHAMAWVNADPLPGMTADGAAEAEMTLALGHPLAFNHGSFLDITGNFTLGEPAAVSDVNRLIMVPAVLVVSGAFALRTGVTLDFGF